ncbi:unnamed protein product [Lepeophtheirus salmonis]|uniref:(salmon louse) hypothetical protein n=1 Tax=Lepeophtheirus salmonis TaxID=72036 RepID=A0A7R8HE20_LEPSM|nr:unnamed protein product [Lepeophtheirus salmonis]CAF3040292.1 unnamed protein product [Lepeophtheirus salmonis]
MEGPPVSTFILHVCLLMKLAVMTSSMEMNRVIVPKYETIHNQWYKDGSEFYRYVPKDNPPVLVFGVSGIIVDVKRSNSLVLALRVLVSKQLVGKGKWRFLDLPDSEPIISGINASGYKVGSWLNVNCTSPNSKPAAKLNWYINNEQVNSLYLADYSPSMNEHTGLYTSFIGLSFKLKRQHFIHGVVTLKCTSKLFQHYFESSEKLITGIGLGEKALESRANGESVLFTQITQYFINETYCSVPRLAF